MELKIKLKRNRIKYIIIYIIIVLLFSSVLSSLFSSFSLASTITGKVYDDSLEQLSNVIITINSNNSNPSQQYISKDGLFQFELEQGSYIINAKYIENKIVKLDTIENINITSNDGNYKVDLILFPSFEEDNSLTDDINIEFPPITDSKRNSFSFMYYILAICLVIIFVIIVVYIIYNYKNKVKNKIKHNQQIEELKKQKLDVKENKELEKREDVELEKLIKFLKENKRVTQKEIRAEIPLSEAKVSLMITELEHKGLIEKIKKGRGNIIIYK